MSNWHTQLDPLGIGSWHTVASYRWRWLARWKALRFEKRYGTAVRVVRGGPR